jgi:hypothetical protein
MLDVMSRRSHTCYLWATFISLSQAYSVLRFPNSRLSKNSSGSDTRNYKPIWLKCF